MKFKNIPIIKPEHRLQHTDSFPGFPPYTRGNRALGHILSPITVLSQTEFANAYPDACWVSSEKLNDIYPTFEKTLHSKTLAVQFCTENPISQIAFVRALRTAWAAFLSSKQTDIWSINLWGEYLGQCDSTLALFLGCEFDGIISSSVSNEEVLNFCKYYYPLKPIDPWGGSFFIEKQTKYFLKAITK